MTGSWIHDTMAEVLSQIAEILVAATVVLLPLITTSGGIDNFREPKDSLLIAAAALLVVVGAVRFVFRPEKMSLRGGRGRPPLLFLAVLVWTFLSAAFATNRHDTVAPVVWVCALAVFAFTATVLARREGTVTVLWALVAPLINAAIFLMQRFHFWNPIRFAADVPAHFRYTALIGNPDDASSFFVAPLIAALALVLVTRGWRRWAAATAFAVLAAAVVTGRLTSILAVGAGLLTLAIVREHKRALPVIALAIAAVVIAGLAYAPLRSRLQLIAGQFRAGDVAEATSGRVTPFLAAAEMGVLCLAHFPLHLTAPALMFVYFGALVYGWSDEAPQIEELRIPRAVAALAALAVIAGAAWITLRFAYDPFIAEGKKLQLKNRTEQVLAMGDPYRAAPIAREDLAKIGEYLPKRPGDVDYLMMRGANDRVLGNYEEARASYQEALRYDRRPELYSELGVTELQMGRRAEALDALFQAVLFSRIYFEALSPDVRSEERSVGKECRSRRAADH